MYALDAAPGDVTNVYGRPEYAALTEELKVKMWHAQEAVGDLPHSSQPVPPGCEPAPAASGVVTAGRTVTPVASD